MPIATHTRCREHYYITTDPTVSWTLLYYRWPHGEQYCITKPHGEQYCITTDPTVNNIVLPLTPRQTILYYHWPHGKQYCITTDPTVSNNTVIPLTQRCREQYSITTDPRVSWTIQYYHSPQREQYCITTDNREQYYHWPRRVVNNITTDPAVSWTILPLTPRCRDLKGLQIWSFNFKLWVVKCNFVMIIISCLYCGDKCTEVMWLNEYKIRSRDLC